ncbi:MAG: XdhC family protein [Thermoflexales bacterium]|nr:XdhC family protein [Thermoflexales bacterium]MCX7939845.1 XdhC family protein [Thermoflexales bacterium]MDW8291733.1 XdhC family protein [Anaerolineae bacterium]
MREVAHQALEWLAQGKPVAIATVVATWGSAPRGLGAKLALTPNQDLAGSVSGGCVEGAVIEAGLEVIAQQQPQRLRFGVSDETAFEKVGLACGGTIEVLVEPLHTTLAEAWRRALHEDRALATVMLLDGTPMGSCLALAEHGEVWFEHPALSPEARAAAHALAAETLAQRQPRSTTITAAGETRAVFVDFVPAQPQLIVIGAVHIAIALTALAKALGYRVTVIDPRAAFCNRERFPHADAVIVEHPRHALKRVALTSNTAVVTLTHDSKFDDPALQIALRSPAFYVGALGSRKTHAARRERLLRAGLTEAEVSRLHAPLGLDLGARTPEEIALAALAQIVATRNGKA